MWGPFSAGLAATTRASHVSVQECVARRERSNESPNEDGLTVVEPAGGAREHHRMRWGLIFAWSKEPATGNQRITTRSETVYWGTRPD